MNVIVWDYAPELSNEHFDDILNYMSGLDMSFTDWLDMSSAPLTEIYARHTQNITSDTPQRLVLIVDGHWEDSAALQLVSSTIDGADIYVIGLVNSGNES